MNEGYLRQRRNLISISILLLLAILGGTKVNPLYPFHLERPFVAELFMWFGFGYFWYRTRIYAPAQMLQLFKNEIILAHIREHDFNSYSHYNLGSFVGAIRVEREEIDRTIFKLIGVAEATGSGIPGKVAVPLKVCEIINTRNYLKNLISGKVITDYYLPHFLAIVTLLVGTYKHRMFFPDAYFHLAPVLLVGSLLYMAVSEK